MKKGYFITLEGADGCGKTTQLGLLELWLKDKGYDVIATREPGGEKLGSQIRKILLHYDGDVSSSCESFLFLADRAQHVDKVIMPALAEGKIILCDRYTDSTIAYQGYGKGQDIEQIKYLNDLATNCKKPDLTIVFDVDSETAQKRVGSEKDRMESEGMDFHKKVREGYLELAHQDPDRIKILNANMPIDVLFIKAKDLIKDYLNS